MNPQQFRNGNQPSQPILTFSSLLQNKRLGRIRLCSSRVHFDWRTADGSQPPQQRILFSTAGPSSLNLSGSAYFSRSLLFL
ncbi:hypothetical protein ACX12E_29460 [Paenibacillus vandeheii]